MDRTELAEGLKALTREELRKLLAEVFGDEQSHVNYWMLSWDIPENSLASLVRHQIRPYAVMVHESGYMVARECKQAVEEIVKEAVLAVDQERREKGLKPIQYSRLRWLPCDPHVGDQIVLDWTRERAEVFAKEITESFEKRMAAVVPRIEKLIEEKKIDVNDKDRIVRQQKLAILSDLKRRIADAETAFVYFAMTDKARYAIKASKDLIDAEMKALKEVAKLERERRRMEKSGKSTLPAPSTPNVETKA